MADKSRIEWTEATWNPVTGCTRVSAGCDHCYAARLTAGRLSRHPRYAGLANAKHFTGEVRLHEDLLDQPLRWKRPRMIFVCSMADLFHPAVPFEFIDKVFAVMALCPQHTFQVLTKRPDRRAEYLAAHDVGLRWATAADPYHRCIGPGTAVQWTRSGLSNVWHGNSASTQADFDAGIGHLLRCPAAVRWLSLEPLLESMDLELGHHDDGVLPTDREPFCERQDLLHWVVVGGETGPGARPMHPDWARSVRDQCQAAGVPFFFKHWGNNMPWDDGVRVCTGNAKHVMERVSKKVAGRLLDGREWNEMPAGQRHEAEGDPGGSPKEARRHTVGS